MTALPAATFLLLQLLCQVFVSEGSGCEPPSGYVTFSEYNAAYKVHEEHSSWAEARDRCIAEGGHLAVITSDEQIERIVGPTILESHYFLYIGIHRSATTSQWVRIDNGLPETSISSSDMSPRSGYDCAAVWRWDGGVITNVNCDYNYAFICERSTAEGCPSPVGPEDSQGPPASKGDTEQKSTEK